MKKNMCPHKLERLPEPVASPGGGRPFRYRCTAEGCERLFKVVRGLVMVDPRCYPDAWIGPIGCRGICKCGWVGRTMYKSVRPALRVAEVHAGKTWMPMDDRKAAGVGDFAS